MRQSIGFLLAVTVFLAWNAQTNAAQAPELFISIDPEDMRQPLQGLPNSSTAARSRTVQIDFRQLAAARDLQAPATLVLNLFDDVVVSATVQRTTSTPSGTWSLAGPLDAGIGTVALEIDGNEVVGEVVTSTAVYAIEPGGASGRHVIRQRQADESSLPPASAIPPLRYENLDATLNRIVADFDERDRTRAAAVTAARQAPLSDETSVAVTFHVDRASNVQVLERYLRTNGVDPRNVGEDYIEAYVPVSLLVPASRQPGVFRVRTVVPPRPQRGRIRSQGASVHGSSPWNDAGFTGSGIKVGVIDPGFSGIVRSQDAGELPVVSARCYKRVGYSTDLKDCDNDGQQHGTVVAESLVDIAPDVQLYVADPLYHGDLRDAVDWMIDEGVQVINQSAVWIWDGKGDGSSPYSESPINTVRWANSNDVVWVNAAGNENRGTWYGQLSDSDGNGWHEFAPSDERNYLSGTGGTQTIQIRAQHGASFCVFDDEAIRQGCSAIGDTLFAAVMNVSTERGKRYYVGVKGGARLYGWVQLQNWDSSFSYYSESGAIGNPAETASLGMLAVGAAHWKTPAAIAGYSSRGPLPASGQTKPDIVGASSARTYLWSSFSGTSQASPHVAGLAALVRQRFPSYSANRVTRYLKDSALHRGTPYNNTWGHGFAKLPKDFGSDLIVRSISVDDDTLGSGQQFTLSFRVYNQGTSRSETTQIAIEKVDGGSYETVVSGTLQSVGARSEIDWSYLLSAPSAGGTHEYRGCVSGTSGETQTLNNCSIPVRVTVEGAGVSADRQALTTLYNATNGPGWLRRDNWLSDEPLGTWYGVSADAQGRVDRLDLPRNQLRGRIPDALGDLSSLVALNLLENELTGSIPHTLARLPRLQLLYLLNNELTGPIPLTTLLELGNLRVLDIGGNRLTGGIPADLVRLTGLVRLRLNNNQLSGQIPAELGRLTGLTELALSSNQLSGSIPAELGNLTNLDNLSLNNNQLSGSIPATLGGLSRVTRLALSDNQLSGPIPAELGNMTRLRYIYIDDDTNLCLASDFSLSSAFGRIAQRRGLSVCGGGCEVEDLGTLSGTVTHGGTLGHDCVAPNWGGELARYYSFTLAQAAEVRIEMTARDFDAWIGLRGPGADMEGTLLSSVGSSGTGNAAVLTTSTLEARTYTIEASSDEFNVAVTGDFTLRIVAAGNEGGLADRTALVALFNATGGPNWSIRAGARIDSDFRYMGSMV